MTEQESVIALGRLTAGGEWVGLLRSARGWDLVFGGADGSLIRGPGRGHPNRPGLIAAAAAYFSEALGEAPPAFEATQADLADLIRWLAQTEPDPPSAKRLFDAIDAIDDGLAGDVVANRLTDREANEQIDPIDLLVELYRAR